LGSNCGGKGGFRGKERGAEWVIGEDYDKVRLVKNRVQQGNG